MTIWEAIILGLVQGATEFLPVSSSGHSVLIPAVFNLAPPTLNAVAIAHLGTLLAVLVYFYTEISAIVRGVLIGLKERNLTADADGRLGWLIVVGSIPAAVLGLTLEDFFEQIFATPLIAAGFLIGTAVLLVLGEWLRSGHKEMTGIGRLDTLIIGLFQALALFPGISRSGSTIVGGLLRGLDRSTAARYSFLLGIPAIFGAGLLSLLDLFEVGLRPGEGLTLTIVFVTAAVSGYACIHLLLQWVKQRSLYPFAAYCVGFAIFCLVWLSI